MIKKQINLTTIEQAQQFVSICMALDFKVELVSDPYVVDAKSIMGLLSLDFSKPITVQAHCAADDPFFDRISAFLVKDGPA